MRSKSVDYGGSIMHAASGSFTETVRGLCSACGIPFDSQYFDESGVFPAPKVGETRLLAEVVLPPQYCGVLEYFAQFTDQYAGNRAAIRTDGIEWLIQVDGSPLFPYLRLDRIINPWGEGSHPVAIRLPENTTIRFIARGVATRGGGQSPINEVGGRLLGRYWYNATYGNAAAR